MIAAYYLLTSLLRAAQRVSPARLKTLEAIAKIRDKENKILSFIILEWSLQRQKYETDVSNGGRFLRIPH